MKKQLFALFAGLALSMAANAHGYYPPSYGYSQSYGYVAPPPPAYGNCAYPRPYSNYVGGPRYFGGGWRHGWGWGGWGRWHGWRGHREGWEGGGWGWR